MRDMMFLKPVGPHRVQDPDTGTYLHPLGEWKRRCQHWLRRIEEGVVVEATPAPAAVAAAQAEVAEPAATAAAPEAAPAETPATTRKHNKRLH